MGTMEEQEELKKLEAEQAELDLKERGVERILEQVEPVKREMERAKRAIE